MNVQGKDLGADPNYVPPPRLNGKVAKPNKYPACAEVHEMYFQCALVTEAGFGKFINRCAQLKEKLDECNVREQAIRRQAKLAESKEKQARIKAKMDEIESRVAEKLAGTKTQSEQPPQKGGWSF